MTDSKILGRIIKLSKTGWGFISSKEIEFTRIFFHWTALRQDTHTFPELKTGMTVEFTPLAIPGKGYRAVQIRVVEKPKRVGVEARNEPVQSDEGSDVPALSEQGSEDVGAD